MLGPLGHLGAGLAYLAAARRMQAGERAASRDVPVHTLEVGARV